MLADANLGSVKAVVDLVWLMLAWAVGAPAAIAQHDLENGQMSAATITAAVITGILAMVGSLLVVVINRQVNFGIAQQRRERYAELWSYMAVTSPMEHNLKRIPPLCPERRERLYKQLTRWYFQSGGGMILSAHTRNMYLAVKENLICEPAGFTPVCLRSKVEDDVERAYALIRQFSLLRTRMKADLAVYGSPFYGTLNKDDVAFLKECQQYTYLPPWNPPFWKPWQWFQRRTDD